jgi:hypothetical protein
MGEYKIISNTDDELEIEITQPNDLVGDQTFWTEEDYKKWNEKMDKLILEGTRGELETIRIKLKKNPFIDGQVYTGGENTIERNREIEQSNESISNSSIADRQRKLLEQPRIKVLKDNSQGSEIQSE